MASDLKPTVDFDETFGKLDIRLGKVLSAELEPSAPKKSYRLKIDFGKYGVRTSVGRFTQHTPEELIGKQVMGVLNFEPRQIGDVRSDVVVIGIQFKGAESGEATPVTPMLEGKLGSKLF